MLLRNAMRRPRAVEYGSVSWEDLNQKFRKIFLSGGLIEVVTGYGGK